MSLGKNPGPAKDSSQNLIEGRKEEEEEGKVDRRKKREREEGKIKERRKEEGGKEGGKSRRKGILDSNLLRKIKDILCLRKCIWRPFHKLADNYICRSWAKLTHCHCSLSVEGGSELLGVQYAASFSQEG